MRRFLPRLSFFNLGCSRYFLAQTSIAISVGLHLMLIFFTSFKLPKDPLQHIKPQKFPLRIIQTPEDQKTNRLTPSQSFALKNSKMSRKRNFSFKKEKSTSNPRHPRQYRDLLPKLNDISNFSNETAISANSGHVNFESTDPENDGISLEKKNRNYSELSTFSMDLAQRIFVPRNLIEFEPSGRAFARFTRNRAANTWIIQEIKGHAYARSILFEALTTFKPNELGLRKLSESEFDTIRIEFRYAAKSVTILSAPKPSIQINGNKISIDVEREFIDKKWMLVGPGYLNIIGAGLYIADKMTRDPKLDLEVAKLKQSPAFFREQ
jgi:hypothetical protein